MIKISRHYKNAFSLIEVIVATSILTIAVFGVYRLIAENNKIISNSDNYMQANLLFPNLETCINYLGFDSFYNELNNSFTFNFGVDNKGCFTGTANELILDNIKYQLSGNITRRQQDSINWQLNISGDGINNIQKDFIQIR